MPDEIPHRRGSSCRQRGSYQYRLHVGVCSQVSFISSCRDCVFLTGAPCPCLGSLDVSVLRDAAGMSPPRPALTTFSRYLPPYLACHRPGSCCHVRARTRFSASPLLRSPAWHGTVACPAALERSHASVTCIACVCETSSSHQLPFAFTLTGLLHDANASKPNVPPSNPHRLWGKFMMMLHTKNRTCQLSPLLVRYYSRYFQSRSNRWAWPAICILLGKMLQVLFMCLHQCRVT